MFSFETKIRVRYGETDQMGVVYHSNYFLYYEVSRAESFRQIGFSYLDMEKMGIIMPVVEIQSRFLKPALYDDLLTVKTILKGLPVHHKIEFQHEVHNEQNELLATGKIILCFMNSESMKPAAMPEHLKQRLLPYFS